MKLLQLRYLVEVVRHDNHISNTAHTLHTSQPGISKQIQLLEEELGFQVFTRKRNRIVGLTAPGREVVAIAQRVMGDVDSIELLRNETGQAIALRMMHGAGQTLLTLAE